MRVAVRAGVLTSHRFPIISACVTSTWERGVASAGQLVSGLMDTRPQMPSVLSRTKGLLWQRRWMSLVSVHIFRFGPDTTACSDFRSVDFDIGVPLPKSHIHNVFKPISIISVDNGQTEKKHQVACFRVCIYGNTTTGKGARWVWMRLAGPAVAEVRTFGQG